MLSIFSAKLILMQVEFPTELFIKKVSIYETYHAGAVTSIGAWNPSSHSYVSVYHGQPTVMSRSRIFEPVLEVL